jgi:Zn-dependent peptidase ImmA (M78 family)
MTRSATAMINPELLKWAREASALTLSVAAEKIKVKLELLEEWEKGLSLPTFKQLLTIAKVYKRPLPVFYLSEPPKNFQVLHDYRKLPDTIPSLNESPQLNFEIRKAYYRRQVALDLIKLLEEDPIPALKHTVSLSQNPEEIGEDLRRLLKVSLKDQTSWKTPYDALKGWRTALEDIGVFVFQAEKIDVMEMRGFAISERPLPVIVINKKDSPKGRIFSMLHEFTHILMGDSSISGNEQSSFRLPAKEQKIETFCNSVAASMLLPLSAFHEDTELMHHEKDNDWNDTIVMNVAHRFNVSRECVWRRLLTRKKITQAFYQKKRDELLNEFQRQKEKAKPSSGGPPYHIKVLSSMGALYSELVLNSYYREKITASSLSDYLGVKLRHLSKIEHAVFNTSQGVQHYHAL